MKNIFISLLLFSQFSNAQVTLVKDIRSGSTGSALSSFIVYNNKIYFKANDGTNGSELWSSDGTSSGTVMVADYNSGSTSFNPSTFTLFNNKLYFSGLTSATGSEIFSFDGTSISLAADIKPGSGSSAPGFIVEMGGNLYIRAQEAASTNYRLYKMDTSNTYSVLDNTLLCGLSAAKLGSNLLFAAGTVSSNTQLYSTDGNTTTLIKTINPSATSSLTEFFVSPTMNKMFFQATDGTNGKELWVTDGTASGTVMLADINTSGDSSPANFYEYNGKVYFSASSTSGNAELWVTDGTSATLVKEINPSGSSSPNNFFSYNGKLYFTANDGTNGTELWRTDGTAANTLMVADINPGSNSSSPTDLTAYNGNLYLAADNGTVGKELYQVDNSVLSANNIKSVSLSVYPNPSTNGNFYFSNPVSGQYTVYGFSGNLIKKGTLVNSKELSLNLPNGNYLLVVKSNTFSKTFNIVVRN